MTATSQPFEWDKYVTTDARRTIDDAMNRGMKRGLQLTEVSIPVLVIWSILRWEGSVAKELLKRRVADMYGLEKDIDSLLGKLPGYSQPDSAPGFVNVDMKARSAIIDYKSCAECILVPARAEMSGLGNAWLGTEHLLIAAVQSPSPELQLILGRRQVHAEDLRREHPKLMAAASPSRHD